MTAAEIWILVTAAAGLASALAAWLRAGSAKKIASGAAKMAAAGVPPRPRKPF